MTFEQLKTKGLLLVDEDKPHNIEEEDVRCRYSSFKEYSGDVILEYMFDHNKDESAKHYYNDTDNKIRQLLVGRVPLEGYNLVKRDPVNWRNGNDCVKIGRNYFNGLFTYSNGISYIEVFIRLRIMYENVANEDYIYSYNVWPYITIVRTIEHKTKEDYDNNKYII